MKTLTLLTVTLFLVNASQAQSWLPEAAGTTNLEEIISSYKNQNRTGEENRSEELLGGKIRKEGKGYHIDRWTWHWQQHLDENGKLASPMRTFKAWQQMERTQRHLKQKFKTTNQSQWSFVGPSSSPGGYNGIGRINDIGFHPTDTNTFIVATAGGGAWRTTNGGVNWTCLTDMLPVLGTSDIDYNPLNPNTIFLCTGDKNAGDSYSVGVLKSTDGGATWGTTGLQFNTSSLMLTNSLLINPLDTNSLTLATNTSILKSYDGGATWTQTVTGNFKELLYNSADTAIIHAASSSSGAVWRSADGGLTWQSVLSFPLTSRASIAVTPAEPGVVKAVFATASNGGLYGIYHSSDSGKTFSHLYGSSGDCSTNILNGASILSPTTCSGQGWYDLTIVINPLNANEVLVGGINTHRSVNGGLSWDIVTEWTSNLPGVQTVHADKHKLKYNPINPAVLYECNDGGVYKSYFPTLWTDLSNGLQITQFYRIAGSDMANFVIAGSQDNGTKRVTFTGGSNELTGGDGMDCQIDFTNPNIFYTSSQYGNFRRTTNNGGNFTNISNKIPGDSSVAWITPLVIHPSDPSMLIVGYAHVYYSGDRGDNWVDISPGFSNGVNITRISTTIQDQNRIFILQGGTIRYTKDFGNSWSAVPFGFGGSISDIMIDPTDTNRLFVTYSGYGATKVAQYYFGSGWSKIQDSIPNVPVHCFAYDTSNNTRYIGTDIGVFYQDASMNSWAPYNSGLPAIEVTDISINYATQELWASTYGRGVWKSPKHAGSLSVPSFPLALDVITVSPNPNKGQFTISTTNTQLQSGNVNVRILNYSGTTAMNVEGRFDASGKLSINAGNLVTGTYIVEVSKNKSIAARTKMVIL
ncbi:MAG TPA: T9SS type A sorting domain-containing protein [Flavipsychrobacter sp.]|nr:T9SS type A sorting domain-containing protein [Flavipsychrobacter sp.]